jgi:hypothetical protein
VQILRPRICISYVSHVSFLSLGVTYLKDCCIHVATTAHRIGFFGLHDTAVRLYLLRRGSRAELKLSKVSLSMTKSCKRMLSCIADDECAKQENQQEESTVMNARANQLHQLSAFLIGVTNAAPS